MLKPDSLRFQFHPVSGDFPITLYTEEPRGCISHKKCAKCGIDILMDSTGKGVPRVENGKAYVQGPCLCGPVKCPSCGFQPLPLELIKYSEIPYSD